MKMYQNKELRIETTTKCNYDCVMCPRELLTRKLETMSLETFIFLMDKVKKYDFITLVTLSGYGEAFMDPTLFEKMAIIKERGYKLHLLTTGSLLTEKKVNQLIELEVDELRFSHYGMTRAAYKAVHKPFTQKDMFYKTRDLILGLLERKPSNMQVALEYILLEENKHEMEDWKKYWLASKADIVEIWKPHNWATYHYRQVEKDNRRSCNRPFNGPYQIQVDGTINMCCFDFNGELELGDLKTQELDEIMTSPALQKIQAAHTTNNYEGLLCDTCDQLQQHDDACIFTNYKKDSQRTDVTSSGFALL